METKPESISRTVTITRGLYAPLHARRAASEVPALFDLSYLDYLIDTKETDNPIGPGNSSVSFRLGKATPKMNRQFQRYYLENVARNPATRTVGHMLLEASYRRHLYTYPLTKVGIHSNEPGTEFKPHRDLLEGFTTSTALTKGILRVHADDHGIIAEEELSPGDEVTVCSPKEVDDREVHSFASVETESRLSLVCKYKIPREFAELRQTSDYDQEHIDKFFSPRP